MGTPHHRQQSGWIAHCIAAAVIITMCAGSARSQQSRRPSIIVQVLDQQGGAIAGAHAGLTDATGQEKSGLTNEEGKFIFSDLSSGNYALRITAEHFRVYENKRIQVASGPDINLNVTLRIAGVEETIAVFANSSANQEVEYIGGSLVIRGKALESLVGTGGLEALLRALTARTSGPFGPTVLVNGFESGQLPDPHSVREVRINDNPFSAEYDKLGVGRVEILTKPGSDKLHGTTFGNLGDANVNSRNPFAENTVHYESQLYGGNISGPIWPKRATFFIDFDRERADTNAVVNATVVDPAYTIVPLRQAVVTPQLKKSFSPRLDYQMNASNTFVLRYADSRTHESNSGVGEFSLVPRAQDSNGRVQTFQLTETAVLGSKAINETRTQLVRTRTSRYGNNSTPVIDVPGAFMGGGADIGQAYNRQNFSELQNITSFQVENHILKFGVQATDSRQLDGSTENFGGTYTFAPRLAPQLSTSNQVVTDAGGTPVMTVISNIEAYRRTVFFLGQGLPPAEVRTLGGGASQFSITAGNQRTAVQPYQVGAFLQDNWRLHPKFTLSPGLRYDRQSNVSRNTDFAPRVAFAWGLGGGTTVVRAGTGIFYDRIPDHIVLRARQMDGVRQREFFVSDNSLLDLFPAVPTPSLLTGFAAAPSTVRLAGDLRSPYTINSSIAVERQLLEGFTAAVTLSRLRSVHLLRSRNVNAPLPGTYDPAFPQRVVRPFGTPGDIFQYETSGVSEQRELLINLVYRANKDLTLWSTYTLSKSMSDTDSPDTFPSNSYDLRGEYGRSGLHARNTVFWGGWIQTKGGIELTPLVLWRSQVPFDITTGSDVNGDSLFTDRPAFATDFTRPSVIMTRFGAFDLSPLPGQRIIPRNLGYSPGFFIANLRVGRTIPLGKKGTSLAISIQGTNIFNHTNPGAPIGNLGSPLFGISNTSAGDWGFGSNQAGNRRLEAGLYVMF